MESNKQKINIAITGCIHGSMKKMYDDIWNYSQQNKMNIDLVLCTGDFECMIEQSDMKYLSCPDKYKHMGDFHKYYEGLYPVPFLTIFIGGNHEASNILHDNFYGGYIMEKVYYLGRAGLIKYKGIRIGGLSGIYNKFDYLKGHYEDDIAGKDIKSIFHVREYEIAKLSNLTGGIDIMMSHDWPTGIVDKKDFKSMTKNRVDLLEDLKKNELGSPYSEFLLKMLEPKYWICGHMHYYYKNTIEHPDKKTTNVFALDKCLNNRRYFDVITLEVDSTETSEEIKIDSEWIAITQIFDKAFPINNINYNFSDYISVDKDYYVLLVTNYYKQYIKNTKKITVSSSQFTSELNELKKITKDTKVELNSEISSLFGLGAKNAKNSEEIEIDL